MPLRLRVRRDARTRDVHDTQQSSGPDTEQEAKPHQHVRNRQQSTVYSRHSCAHGRLAAVLAVEIDRARQGHGKPVNQPSTAEISKGPVWRDTHREAEPCPCSLYLGRSKSRFRCQEIFLWHRTFG